MRRWKIALAQIAAAIAVLKCIATKIATLQSRLPQNFQTRGVGAIAASRIGWLTRKFAPGSWRRRAYFGVGKPTATTD
jgi:hypothetical protein